MLEILSGMLGACGTPSGQASEPIEQRIGPVVAHSSSIGWVKRRCSSTRM